MRPAPAPVEPARRWRFLPPLLWMGLIAMGSSSALGADHTERWASAALGRLLPHASPALIYDFHTALRKMGHVVEYGILAVLWRRALAPAPRALIGALALAAAYAGVDEWRQGLAPNRDASAVDALLDSVAAAGALAAWEGRGRVAAITFRALAWAATLGAALAAAGAALDLAVGSPPATLGLTAGGLAVAAAALGCAARLAATPPVVPAPAPL
jgi:VanZ family protein